jgi:hypothetical protein
MKFLWSSKENSASVWKLDPRPVRSLIFHKLSSLGRFRIDAFLEKIIFASQRTTLLQREGFVRFPVFSLGEDPGLFLPVALSGKFNICSTTDCSYYVSSAGSIQCAVKGSPAVDQGLHQGNFMSAKLE